MLSPSSRHALGALVELASPGRASAGAAALGRALGAAPAMVERALAVLTVGGLVRAAADGRLELARDPAAIRVGEVLALLGDPLAAAPPAGASPGAAIDQLVERLRGEIAPLLERTSIADLAADHGDPDSGIEFFDPCI